jgi:hypothetical protein
MTCTYRFTGTDGKKVTITGKAAFKGFLAEGGLEQLRGIAFSGRQSNVLDRIPELQTAAQGLKEGTVTREQYDKLVNDLKPVTPYKEVPPPATKADMERGLTSDKVERINVPSETLQAGDPVGIRLDIPAYSNHGVWVVSVHQQEAGYSAGKSIGYESVAAVTNPTFGVVEKAALSIAGGKPKSTIAVMKGDWKPVSPKQASAAAKLAMKSDKWVQVGMDPTRHAYFYDRDSMEPVVSADEAIQIGPLVLAKNPVYGEKSDFAFSKREQPVYEYEVVDPRDNDRVMGRYQSRSTAIAGRDRFDNKYGAYRYKVRKIEGVESQGDIGAALEDRVDNDFEALVEEYNNLKGTDGGKVLDTDIARELSPEYRADRSRAGEVHEAVSKFIDKLYKSRIEETSPDGVVVFMAGGGGAGKSSAGELISEVFDMADIVYDGTLSTYSKAEQRIKLALDKGQDVYISYIYREPTDALRNGVLTRAMVTGRTVPLDGLVKGHAGSSETVKKLQETFGDNPAFKIFAIDNSKGLGNATLVPLTSIPDVTMKGLKERFENVTNEEYEAGRISETIRRATLGESVRESSNATQANRESDQEGIREGRQPVGKRDALKLQRRQTQTPEFKRWFGDSKVLDKEGNPLVVYHGTTKDFNVFTSGKNNRLVKGIYFSSETDVADIYASKTEGSRVLPVYLSLQNPATNEDYDRVLDSLPLDKKKTSAQRTAALKKAGFDGLMFDMSGGKGAAYDFVVFDNSDIKSIFNESPTDNPDISLQRRQRGRETEGWVLSRDELGRFRFGAGAKAYRYAADVANIVLDKVGMKPVSEDLGRAMRKMKAEVERAQRLTVDVANKMKTLPEQERQMISDVIEGELKRGTKPPKHVLELAASLQSIMSEQSAELVRLGMLSPEAAGRWDGKYLPRFYEQKLGDEVKAWSKAAKALLGRKKTMQGIGGSSLKSRGMFENIPVDDLADWEDEGWQVRDDDFDPNVDDTITVWRDYTRNERDDMGEIRDAMFRFVMGYNKSQRDIALGRLYESLAQNYASKRELPGYVKVPDTKVEDTQARRYGMLAGKWVPAEVLDHLSAFDQTQQNELIKMYLKGLSMWKEGKTVLNPVSHANNVLSNLTMAHFAGVSYWDITKYAGAMRELIKKDPMVNEALDAGLFGGTFNRAELLDQMPEQLKALANVSESRLKRGVDTTWNALSWFLRRPAAAAYQAEDQFFRYLIYREARQRGLDVEDAIDYAQNYLFTYDDLPKGARTLRDYALPFFAYTYKVVPPLVNTALEKPWRFAAPAAALYTVNALMYAMAASLGGGEDEDWWTVIRRYVTDPEFRDKARAMEKEERKNLPPWMKGASFTLGTPKAIRLGMDDVTNLPVFLDVSRVFPGGDLLDAHANAGGVPLLQPITPSNPVLNTVGAMIWNKDSFFGKDIVDKNDTSAEAAQKRGKWLWQQFAPAVAIGNYHWDRAMNVIANQTGQPVLGYTGISKDGLPVQAGYALAQTVGIKMRPIDLDLSAAIAKSEKEKLIRDIDTELRRLKRLEGKGAISSEAAEKERERQQEKKSNLKEGLTVEGKPID